ncbi:SLC2A4 regulator isoform X2 [Microtus pennsylvanicus]
MAVTALTSLSTSPSVTFSSPDIEGGPGSSLRQLQQQQKQQQGYASDQAYQQGEATDGHWRQVSECSREIQQGLWLLSELVGPHPPGATAH